MSPSHPEVFSTNKFILVTFVFLTKSQNGCLAVQSTGQLCSLSQCRSPIILSPTRRLERLTCISQSQVTTPTLCSVLPPVTGEWTNPYTSKHTLHTTFHTSMLPACCVCGVSRGACVWCVQWVMSVTLCRYIYFGSEDKTVHLLRQ